MHIIHEEILSFFVMQQRITVEYMNFNETSAPILPRKCIPCLSH